MTIEIGTSDFRTQAGQVDGVFIEPVKYYFDRLKQLTQERSRALTRRDELAEDPTTHFENVAISDYEGEVDMVFMDDEQIAAQSLPQWVRGCNTMNEIHPSVKRVMQERGEDGAFFTKQKVKVVRIKSIIDKYNITSLDLLKIDTEGHDCVILNDYLNTVEILPKVIQFESNELSDPKEVANVVARLKPLGYDCKQVNFDMVCSL